MSKPLLKKYIILFFVIALPLLAAFLVGSYGYNSEKFGRGSWYLKYSSEYFSFNREYTTREKIHKALKYGLNSYYYLYDEEPFYSETIKNENDEELFKLEIYRAIYQIYEDEVLVDRVQYLYTLYGIKYLTLRQEFNVDSGVRRQIDNSDVPALSIKVYQLDRNGNPLRDDDRQIGMVSFLSISGNVEDSDSDVHFKSGNRDTKKNDADELVTCPLGVHKFTYDDIDWSITGNVLVEIKATVEDVRDEDDKPIETLVKTIELGNYESNPEHIDYANYTKSHMQDLRKNTNYFSWAFKHYLWWISLITFAIVAFITLSFYFAWLAETSKKVPVKKTRR